MSNFESNISNSFFEVLTSILFRTVEDVVLHPVNLELIWKEYPTTEFEVLILKQINFSKSLDSETKLEILNQLNSKISIFGWDAVILPKRKLTMYAFQELEVRKEKVEKFDDMDFFYESDNFMGITLKNLTEACYRLKTLKYNYINETVSKIKLIEETSDGYVLKIIFNRD
jgi:hypothetical protein